MLAMRLANPSWPQQVDEPNQPLPVDIGENPSHNLNCEVAAQGGDGSADISSPALQWSNHKLPAEFAMSEVSSPRWLPSEQLRQWTAIGAVALAIQICLSTASLVSTLIGQQPPGDSSLTQLLDTSTLIPEFLILVAFLKLARETASLGLYCSSTGFFASAWLLQTFALIDANGEWGDIILAILLVIGTVVMFVVVFRDRSHMPEFAGELSAGVNGPDWESEPGPTAEKSLPRRPELSPPNRKASSSSGWGCGSALLVGVVLKALSRGLRNANFNWIPIFAIGLFFTLVFTSIVFSIWFGLSKIRLRDKLGPVAMFCGAADILALAAELALLGLVLSIAMAEREPDFREPMLLIPMVLASVVDIARTGLYFALFITIGQRIADPWKMATQLEGGRRPPG